jgi:hypothetical protein
VRLQDLARDRETQPGAPPGGFVVKNQSKIFAFISAGIPGPSSMTWISTIAPRRRVRTVRFRPFSAASIAWRAFPRRFISTWPRRCGVGRDARQVGLEFRR